MESLSSESAAWLWPVQTNTTKRPEKRLLSIFHRKTAAFLIVSAIILTDPEFRISS